MTIHWMEELSILISNDACDKPVAFSNSRKALLQKFFLF